MTNRERNKIQCDWFKNPDREWLKQTWVELEARSDASFFLSWQWIGTWLDCFVEDFTVLEARKQGETVGLGIFVTQNRSFSTQGLRKKHYLHRTGVPEEDQIWIEYNDFLLSANDTEDIRLAMLSSVAYWMKADDALIIGASPPEKYTLMTELGLKARTIWETTNYFLELSTLRDTGKSLLKSISRSSRYQITRSLRKYSEIGEVRVEKMQSQEDAMRLLDLAEPIHLTRWGNGKSGSGFANPKFVKFHKQLISKGLPSGVVALYHIKAGDETIGIVYNFLYRNVVYFYFCAMNYCHNSSQYKPGLVSHYLLIEKALSEGVDVYDFMGGTARYKATFANKQGKLVVYQFEHPGILLSFENLARKAKHSHIWSRA